MNDLLVHLWPVDLPAISKLDDFLVVRYNNENMMSSSINFAYDKLNMQVLWYLLYPVGALLCFIAVVPFIAGRRNHLSD